MTSFFNANTKENGMAKIPHTVAVLGEQVTTIGKFGNLGIGYLVDGVVYKTTGSFWAIDARKDLFPMVSYIQDGGQEYLEAARA